MNVNKLRMPLDILMTVLSIILMGGAYLFPSDIVHEILGVSLFVLWVVHITLNRRWYGAVFHGKYNAHRIMQTIINCGILICTIFLMISGIILSNRLFVFLGIEKGLGFARIAHLLASHWYFVFMSFHIGLHIGMILGKINVPKDGRIAVALRVAVALISLYGIYAFITRGVWRYLILRQQFFFLDLEKGYALFFADYISIIVFLAISIHIMLKKFKNTK